MVGEWIAQPKQPGEPGFEASRRITLLWHIPNVFQSDRWDLKPGVPTALRLKNCQKSSKIKLSTNYKYTWPWNAVPLYHITIINLIIIGIYSNSFYGSRLFSISNFIHTSLFVLPFQILTSPLPCSLFQVGSLSDVSRAVVCCWSIFTCKLQVNEFWYDNAL